VSARLRRPDRTRVFMTADAVGGVWQYALDLARGLAGAGVTTTLAILGPAPSSGQASDARAIPGLTLIDTGLPLDWTADSPEAVLQSGAAVARLAAESGADIVHLNSPALAAGATFAAPVVTGCHSCVATWWEAVRSGPLPTDFRWRTDLTARGYAGADALLAPTQAFAQATARTYGLARAPTVVHNGRHHAPAPRALAAPDEPFVFTAGRLWDEGKNVAALDRAAARLAAPVLAAGPTEGPNGATVTLAQAEALGTLGSPELAGYLAAQPVFASLALYEPFGLAVLEAAQAGCPLVLSDIPTFRELWDGAAAFVPPNDDVAIAAALETLLRDRGARARAGAAAQERAARYTVEAMTAGLLAVYGALLAARAPRAIADAAA
jgi:glycosyltransferase involved in cell wall biosynthesis